MGVWIFKNLIGRCDTQQRLTTHAPRLGLAIFLFLNIQGQIVNILTLAGHLVSASTPTLLCYWCLNAAIDPNKQIWPAFQRNIVYNKRLWVGFGLQAGVCCLLVSSLRQTLKTHSGGSEGDNACPSTLGSIPGWRRSPGGGNGKPLPYSCLENSMDKGAWQTTYSPWGKVVGHDLVLQAY